MLHEQQLAEKLYRILQTYLPPDSSRRLRKIVVRCGQLDKVDSDRLGRCWHAVAAGPAYQASHIELHYDPPGAKCTDCNHAFELSEDTSCCPRCGCEQFVIVHQPPTLETYELE